MFFFFWLQPSFSKHLEKLNCSKKEFELLLMLIEVWWHQTKMELSLSEAPCLELAPNSTLLFLFLAKFSITLESKLELKFFYTWKLEKKNQIQFPNSYLKLVVFLLRCVDISSGFQAFPSSCTKKLIRMILLRMGIYTNVWTKPYFSTLWNPKKIIKHFFR